MSNEMIPFGKYKGQPLEVLEHDPEYADWIAQQSWAKERYPQIVNIIINKFGESEETPDHNAMQAKFLDPSYCVMAAGALGMFKFRENPLNQVAEIVEFAKKHKIEIGFYKPPSAERMVGHIELEVDAIDVQFQILSYGTAIATVKNYLSPNETRSTTIIYANSRNWKLRLELKPTVGDDYPAVLRQMRNNGSDILVYGKYSGAGVTEEVFRRFFKSQGIDVISEAEIEAKRERLEPFFSQANKIAAEVNEAIKSAMNKKSEPDSVPNVSPTDFN